MPFCSACIPPIDPNVHPQRLTSTTPIWVEGEETSNIQQVEKATGGTDDAVAGEEAATGPTGIF